MRRLAVMLALAWALAGAPTANACSCVLLTGTHEQQVEQSVAEADVVFVARLMRSTLMPDPQHKSLVIEAAQFEVLEVFKGGLSKGQTVQVRQVVSSGSCAQSSTNDPAWLYDAKMKPGKISREWLVYAHDPEPFELGRCTRSTPLNVDGGKDLKLLRKFAKRAAKKH